MKASLKGFGGIQRLLLTHGEKVGIAIIGLCAAMFVYASLGHDPLPDQYQANRLKSEIDQSLSAVEEFNWTDASSEDVRVAKYSASGEIIFVEPDAYQTWHHGWDVPVVPPTVLRTDPELLAIQGLDARGGSGLLAFHDEAYARKIELEEEREKQQREAAQKAEQDRQRDRQDEDRGRRGDRDRNQGRGRGEPEVVDPNRPNLRQANTAGVRPPGIQLDGAERIETSYWAVVVAKVPIREQFKRYRDALANARSYDPEADYPQYVGYIVERAEVLPGQPLQFKRVRVYDGQRKDLAGRGIAPLVSSKVLDDVTNDWAEISEEVVSERYLDPDGLLAFPLPPLVGKDWGKDVTHPDIPLAWDDEALNEEEQPEDPVEEAAPAEVDERELLLGGSSAEEGGRRRSAGGREDMRSRGGGRGAEASRGGRGMAYQPRGGRGGADPRAGRFGSRSGRGEAGRGGGPGARPDVAYWLLRFFDFSVEPGKKYKYRVRMVMADVNNTSPSGLGRVLSKDALDPTVLTRQSKAAEARGGKPLPVRYTEWSVPSQTVGIPLAGDVRVAAVRPATDRLFNDEPRVTLMVRAYGVDDKGQAFQAAKEEDTFRRGYVANMTSDVEVLVDRGRYVDLLRSFPFRTGVTIVDIEGGDRLTRDISAPAQALLMDTAGGLYVRKETADIEEVEVHRELFAKPDRDRRERTEVRGGRRG
jgi:hypothetical protein